MPTKNLFFFYDLINPGCRSVMLLLKAERLPYYGVPIKENYKQNNDTYKRLMDEFYKLNFSGSLPFIFNNEVQNGLSQAPVILKYLVNNYKLSHNWMSTSTKASNILNNLNSLIIDEFLFWHQHNIGLLCQKYFEQKVSEQPTNYNALANIKYDIENALELVQNDWLPRLSFSPHFSNNLGGADQTNFTRREHVTNNDQNNFESYVKQKGMLQENALPAAIDNENRVKNMEDSFNLNIGHIVLICSLTQLYVVDGWDVFGSDRPVLHHFYHGVKKKLAHIYTQKVCTRQNSLNTNAQIIENVAKTLNNVEMETNNDIFYAVHKELWDMRNILFQQGKISMSNGCG